MIKNLMYFLAAFVLVTLNVFTAFADEDEINDEHEVIRRVAVLPIDSGERYASEAEIASFNMRKFLGDTKRFFIYSKENLKHRDSYQPRKTISNVDVIILGKLLEADCIVSTYLTQTELKMIAYSGANGFVLWQNSVLLNPSNPVEKQLQPLSQKLIQNFLASIPYQGFQIVDPLIGTATFEEGDITLAKADVGAQANLSVGDVVQWIRIKRLNSNPLFQGGGEYRVIAEGAITKVENQTVLIHIKRATQIKDLEKKSLISFPAEFAKLQTNYSLAKSPTVSTALLTDPMYPTATNATQSKPLVTSVVSIGSIIALLILAL